MITDNPTFEAIRARRTARHYSDRSLPVGLLRELLELANRAPSGFNLQPWHFVIVQDSSLKAQLRKVAMDQAQVVEAPATVVFVADSRVWPGDFQRMLELSVRVGSMDDERADFLRRTVRLFYETGPFGLFGIAKRGGAALRRLFMPTPSVISSTRDATIYVRSQTMLAAATFMIAARSAGLDTSPMEGFDEVRLKKLLQIPPHMTVPVIVAVGYMQEDDQTPMSVRLPVHDKLSVDRFGNRPETPHLENLGAAHASER
jgi:nitroreductase